MRIAVTGSKGFVGKHLLKNLDKSGHEIVEVDLTLGCDITSWESISSVTDFDILVHLAAKSYVPEAFSNPAEYYRANVIGTLNALELCRLHNARMIFVSSYVYGTPEYLPIDENHPLKAFNPYAQSKIIGEDLCRAYFRDFDVPACIFRPFNIYGPGQAGHFLIPRIINQAKTGKIRLKDPRPKRDFIFIDDVVDAIGAAVELKTDSVEVFNLGTMLSLSVKRVVDIVKDIIGEEVVVEFNNEFRKNEVLDTVADISKIKSILSWTPKVSIKKGLAITLGYSRI